MANRRVKFTFSPSLVPQPVIWELGNKFPIVTNIRRAQVEEQVGWVVLELTGDDDKRVFSHGAFVICQGLVPSLDVSLPCAQSRLENFVLVI